jgi:hypothetical protein
LAGMIFSVHMSSGRTAWLAGFCAFLSCARGSSPRGTRGWRSGGNSRLTRA